jgi:hypothetical protein
MRLPGLSADASLYQSTIKYHATWSADAGGGAPSIAPAGCGVLEAAGCIVAGLICGGVCIFDTDDCATCLAGIGASNCLNCLSTGGGNGGGGGGGTNQCCTPGTQCSCGGRCVAFGTGTRCTGTCLRPGERCP